MVKSTAEPESFFVPEIESEPRFIPFYLSEDFVKSYARKKPPWGPIGEFTYLRSYSRTYEEGGRKKKEKWHETIKRVVEGCFTIQKKHCYTHKVPWDNNKAQQSAKIMYDLMFYMKFLPPGRGLWMMGTDYVYKRGSACLNNCFTGDMEFITEEGIKRFKDCAGTIQTVLTENGKWVDAPINSFGKQEIWELTLSRQGVEKVIETTGDHRWFCRDRRKAHRDSGFVEFFTKDLRPNVHHLQYNFGKSSKNIKMSNIGIMHGIAFGDGTTAPGERNSNRIELFGKNKYNMHSIFPSPNILKVDQKNKKSVIGGIPNYYRRLPDVNETTSYLLGWLSGYFSMDGSVSNGQAVISSSKKENLEFFRDVCYRLGIGTYGIKHESRKSNLTGRLHDHYKLTLMTSTLSKDFFIRKDHKASVKENTMIRGWTVKSVRKTKKIKEVFCATVDGIGKFTLADNILTGNCAFVSTKNIANDPTSPFKFLMDMSMLGVGVGFDTKGAGQLVIQKPEYVNNIAYVPDTREGWVETMAIVLNGFFNGGKIPKFDYSKVRPLGSPIRGFGGVASGPGPLMELVDALKDLYTRRIGREISSINIVDTCDMIGRCVVSGNVRRSALIGLGHRDDTDFMDMKNYDLYPKENDDETGWRHASNNTVMVDVGQDYYEPASRSEMAGEPGYLWLANARKYGRMIDPPNNLDYKALGCNPCGEQTLEDRELCCLVETFPSLHTTYDDFQVTLKYAYLYAKTVTLIPTHNEHTNAVMLRNRRIGTSQSGIQDANCRHGRKKMLEWCDHGYRYLRKLDGVYADWLCIPRSIKITSVKPSGSISLLPGVSPGIHYPHSEYYIRRVRIASDSPLGQIMKKAGYKVEKDVKYPKTQVIVEFPVRSENFHKGKSEVTMWEQILNAADYQKWWADNQVSITVSFKQEESRDIPTALSIFDSNLKSLSFLPLLGGNYKQMPYEEITKEKYESIVAKLSKPDYSEYVEQAVGEKYCDGETCEL